MPNEEINSELWRVKQIRENLSFNIEDYLTPEYRAVALHLQSTMVDVNQAAADLFGYTIDEIVGMNAWMFFSVDSAPILMQKLIENSEEPYQVVARRKDDSEFAIEIKGMSVESNSEVMRLVLLREV